MSRGWLLAVLVTAELSTACGTSSNAPSSPTPTPKAATTGSLQVSINGGDAIPGTGYTVTVDGTLSQTSQTNASVTFTGLSAGDHAVALSVYSTRCSATGENPRKVTIAANATVSIAFDVICETAVPATPLTQ